MFDNVPNAKSAIYQAIGAASTCWKGDYPPGLFDQEQAKRIAESLINYLVDQHFSFEERDGVIVHDGVKYYRDFLEYPND